MTDETEAPERIWLEDLEEDPKGMVGYAWGNPVNGLLEPYIRNDLSDAKDKRIAELEAKLAKAVDALNKAKGNLYEVKSFDMSAFEALRVIDATLAELKGTD